jgi:hypothetical protein
MLSTVYHHTRSARFSVETSIIYKRVATYHAGRQAVRPKSLHPLQVLAPLQTKDVQVTAWALGMGMDLPALYQVLVEKFGEDKVTVFPRAPEHVHPAGVSREYSHEVTNNREYEESRAHADTEARQQAIDEAEIIHLYYTDPNGHLRGEVVYVEVGC